MTQDDYNEYAEGYEAGEEAVEGADRSGISRSYVEEVWTWHNDSKSDVWWKGYHDGQDSTWKPPEVESGQENEPAGEGGTLRRNR
jgi:hypothetical protein